MKRFFAASIALAFAVVACNDMGTEPNPLGSPGPMFDLNGTSFEWDGRGTNSERCDLARDEDGWIHWVFATKGTSTNAALTVSVNGIEVDDSPFAPGEPLNANVWHFYTPYYDLDDVTASIELFGGSAGPGGGLVISDYCPGADPFEPNPELTVTKTSDPTFDREHDWSIDKRVDTENKEMKDGYSKIWLSIDGEGDEKATWTVDVTYEGYEDIEPAVSGEIRISLGGNMDAYITSVVDLITQGEGAEAIETPGTLTCALDDESELAVGFPYLMTQGSADIVCTYDEDLDEVLDGVNRVDVAGEFRLPQGAELDGFDPADYPIDEYDEASFDFDGDPENEIHRYASVTDTNLEFANEHGDANGDVVLDARDYVEGDEESFKYSESYAYGDVGFGQDQCEAGVRIDNDAEVRGDNGALLDESDATLLINIQCLIFEGETATGAGIPWSETRRSPNNWFEYTRLSVILSEDGAEIITGRNKTVIGTITGENGDYTTLEFDLEEGWELADVSGAVKVHPMSCDTNQNYVQPGQFDHHFDSFEDAEDFNFAKADCYGIHLDVGQWVPDPDFGP